MTLFYALRLADPRTLAVKNRGGGFVVGHFGVLARIWATGPILYI